MRLLITIVLIVIMASIFLDTEDISVSIPKTFEERLKIRQDNLKHLNDNDEIFIRN